MTGTSVAAAFDWLVATCRTATAAAVTAYNASSGARITGEVFEEWPLVDAPLLVVVGRRSPDDDSGFDIAAGYDLLGARRRSERVAIPFIIQAGVGGNRSISDARKLALLVWDGVVLAVKQDPTLGGVLQGDAALIPQINYQGPRNDVDASNGRTVLVTSELSYTNRYIPA